MRPGLLVSLMVTVASVPACLGTAGAEPARAPAPEPFADVPASHWAADAVDQLAAQGIFTGYASGLYRGDRPITRYEFAVAVQRLLQISQRQDPPPPLFWPEDRLVAASRLMDVPEQHWTGDAVYFLQTRGILKGYPDATFAGSHPLTRSEFAVALARLHEGLIRLGERLIELERIKRRPAPSPPAPVPEKRSMEFPAEPAELAPGGWNCGPCMRRHRYS